MSTERATKKQQQLLEFVEGFIREQGYGPSYREVMSALGYKSVSTVAVHIDGLIAKGFLRRGDNTARSLEVVGRSEAPAEAKSALKLFEKYLAGDITTSQRQTLLEALSILGQERERQHIEAKKELA